MGSLPRKRQPRTLPRPPASAVTASADPTASSHVAVTSSKNEVTSVPALSTVNHTVALRSHSIDTSDVSEIREHDVDMTLRNINSDVSQHDASVAKRPKSDVPNVINARQQQRRSLPAIPVRLPWQHASTARNDVMSGGYRGLSNDSVCCYEDLSPTSTTTYDITLDCIAEQNAKAASISECTHALNYSQLERPSTGVMHSTATHADASESAANKRRSIAHGRAVNGREKGANRSQQPPPPSPPSPAAVLNDTKQIRYERSISEPFTERSKAIVGVTSQSGNQQKQRTFSESNRVNGQRKHAASEAPSHKGNALKATQTATATAACYCVKRHKTNSI